jgi:hypothetical protein
MHVAFTHGISWCWFARYRVVTRWYLLCDEAPNDDVHSNRMDQKPSGA